MIIRHCYLTILIFQKRVYFNYPAPFTKSKDFTKSDQLQLSDAFSNSGEFSKTNEFNYSEKYYNSKALYFLNESNLVCSLVIFCTKVALNQYQTAIIVTK